METIEIIDETITVEFKDVDTFAAYYELDTETAIRVMNLRDLDEEFQYLCEDSPYDELIFKKAIAADVAISAKMGRYGCVAKNNIIFPVISVKPTPKSSLVIFDTDVQCLDVRGTKRIALAGTAVNVVGSKFMGLNNIEGDGYDHDEQYLLGLKLINLAVDGDERERYAARFARLYDPGAQSSIFTPKVVATALREMWTILLQFLDNPLWHWYRWIYGVEAIARTTNRILNIKYQADKPHKFAAIANSKTQAGFLQQFGKMRRVELLAIGRMALVAALGTKIFAIFIRDDPEEMAQFLTALELDTKHQHAAALDRKARNLETNAVGRWLSILTGRLGMKGIKKNSRSVDAIKKMLKPAQVAQVVEIIEREDAHEAAIKNNKCPHVAILRKLGMSHTSKQITLFNELSAFRKKSKEKGKYEVCGQCGYDLACPHVFAIYGAKNGQDMREVLRDFIGLESGNYYACRICFETLPIECHDSIIQYDEMSKGEDDPLKSVLWKETMRIFNYVTREDRQIINKIVTNIYQAVYAEQSKQIRIKTKTIDEADAYIELFAFIHASANLVAMMGKNVDIAFKKGVKVDDGPAQIGRLMQATRLVMMVKNGTIKAEKLTDEAIAKMITAAYKLYEPREVEIDFNYFNPTVEFVKKLVHSPIYDFLYREYILKTGKFNTDEVNKLVFMPSVIGETVEKAMAAGGVRNLDHLRGGDMVANSVIDILEGRAVSAEIQKKLMAQQASELAAAEAAENRGFSVVPHADRTFKRQAVPLALIYDTDGNPHKWTSVIVGGKTMSLAEYSGLVETNYGGKPLEVLDYKCAVCGWLRSEVDGHDDADIRRGIEAKNLRENLFKFYELRCPSGGAHQFDGKTCLKCGLGKMTDAAYYVKWAATESGDKPKSVIIEAVEVIPVIYAKLAKVPDSTAIVQFVANSQLDLSEFRHIGDVNYLTYDDVASIEAMSEIVDVDDHRIYAFIALLRKFVTLYNRVRLSGQFVRMPPDIAAILSQVKSDDKYNILGGGSNAVEKLPALSLRLDVAISAARHHIKDGAALFAYIQGIFVEQLNACSSGGSRLGKVLVKTFLADVMRESRLSSKPGYIPWKLLRENKEVEIEDLDDEPDEEASDDEDDGNGDANTTHYEI